MFKSVWVLAGMLIALVPLLGATIPRPAKELPVKLGNGKSLRLSDYRGQVVALEVLLTTCPGCQRASQILNRLYGEYGKRGLQPLGIAIDDAAKVEGYRQQLELKYPVGYVPRDLVVNFLQHPPMVSMMVPQLVFIDPQGVIRAQYNGTDSFFQDEEKNMRRMIESLLPASKKKATTKKKT